MLSDVVEVFTALFEDKVTYLDKSATIPKNTGLMWLLIMLVNKWKHLVIPDPHSTQVFNSSTPPWLEDRCILSNTVSEPQ
jgi:hypothetical protein